MRISSRSKLSIAFTFFALATVIVGLVATAALRGSAVKAASSSHMHIDCAAGATTCTEVYDSEAVFGEGNYVGHDEPSNLFYSNTPGSGNRNSWKLILPKDPSPSAPTAPGKSFNFDLHPPFWFRLAMCDTQSYPELLPNCKPDGDSNIVDPAI